MTYREKVKRLFQRCSTEPESGTTCAYKNIKICPTVWRFHDYKRPILFCFLVATRLTFAVGWFLKVPQTARKPDASQCGNLKGYDHLPEGGLNEWLIYVISRYPVPIRIVNGWQLYCLTFARPSTLEDAGPPTGSTRLDILHQLFSKQVLDPLVKRVFQFVADLIFQGRVTWRRLVVWW